MSRHLDSQEIAAAVAGLELGASTREHLSSCLECRRQVAAFERAIDGRRRELAAGEPDWGAARAAVLARLAEGAPPRRARPGRWWRPVAAAAAAAAVVVAVGLLVPDGGRRTAGRTELPVEEILAEVDALLEDDSIPGFEVIDPGLDTLESVAASGPRGGT